jgi:hypothetical protein
MSVFHDGLNPFQTTTDQPLKGQTGPQAYKLDVFGDNPYNNPAAQGNAIDRYVQYFANCTVPGQGSCVKPMLFTEFGAPADTHQLSTNLKKVYPLLWTAVNFLWMNSPPPAMCVASTQVPPPGSGGEGAAEEGKSRKTIAQELSATPTSQTRYCGSGAVGRVPTYAGQTPAAGVTFCPDSRWNSPPAFMLIFWGVPARPTALAMAASARRTGKTASFVSAAWLLVLRRRTMRWATIGDERIITFWRNSVTVIWSHPFVRSCRLNAEARARAERQAADSKVSVARDLSSVCSS